VTFFIAYEAHGFFLGVFIFMLATAVSVIAAYLRDQRLALFPTVWFCTVVLFGGMSLLVRNAELFILRDTIVDLVFAGVIFYTLAHGKPILKTMFESTLALTDAGWRSFSIRWGIFELFLGSGNEAIRRLYSYHFWVHYKFVAVIAVLIFGVLQIPLFARTRIPEESNKWGFRPSEDPRNKTKASSEEDSSGSIA
jgi:intracellular septation protein